MKSMKAIKNLARIKAGKRVMGQLDGQNYLEGPCQMVPEEEIDERHGIHSEPYRLEFMLILSKRKYQGGETESGRLSMKIPITSIFVCEKEGKF